MCLLWGVSTLGGVCSQGLSALRGVCLLLGGVCSGGSAPGGGGIPACTEANTSLPVNRILDTHL